MAPSVVHAERSLPSQLFSRRGGLVLPPAIFPNTRERVPTASGGGGVLGTDGDSFGP